MKIKKNLLLFAIFALFVGAIIIAVLDETSLKPIAWISLILLFLSFVGGLLYLHFFANKEEKARKSSFLC